MCRVDRRKGLASKFWFLSFQAPRAVPCGRVRWGDLRLRVWTHVGVGGRLGDCYIFITFRFTVIDALVNSTGLPLTGFFHSWWLLHLSVQRFVEGPVGRIGERLTWWQLLLVGSPKVLVPIAVNLAGSEIGCCYGEAVTRDGVEMKQLVTIYLSQLVHHAL